MKRVFVLIVALLMMLSVLAQKKEPKFAILYLKFDPKKTSNDSWAVDYSDSTTESLKEK